MMCVTHTSCSHAGHSNSQDKYRWLWTERMASIDLTIGVIFLMQMVVGVLGNFSLLCHHIILHFTGSRLRSTDLILKHLIVANFLVLLCKGVPQTMAVFGWKHIRSDFGCKLLFFLHRVGRGVSIGSICLLSVFQVITISPWNSRCAALKVKAPKYMVPSIFLCWILQMLVNFIFPLHINGKWNDKNNTNKKDFGYCSSIHHDKIQQSLSAALLSLPDVLCLGLMLWASSFMVFILYRHKHRVQHIRRTDTPTKFSPESRATKTILLLVSTFVYFYTLSFIFQLMMALFDYPSWFLVNITVILALCVPTVSPFLLMSCDSNVHRLYFAWIKNTKSPIIMRNVWIGCISEVYGWPFINSPQLLFRHSVMSDSLQPHGLQHARLPCPSTPPGVYSDSCPLSRWCHPTISSSVILFSCFKYFPASGSFLMSHFFASGGQSFGASAPVLLMNIQDWFPLELTGWISLQSKGLSRVFPTPQSKLSVLQWSTFLMASPQRSS